MADQRVPPDATTFLALATETSATCRVAWTAKARGIVAQLGAGVPLAVGEVNAGAVGESAGMDESAGMEGGELAPDAWQPASTSPTSAADAARAVIRPA